MEWFESWFDSPYYHILYQNRDSIEAELFIDNLYKYFKIEENDHILDLACGAGRHSIYMGLKGNLVTGLDLAENSIVEAKKKALELKLDSKVNFIVFDMRKFNLEKKFNYVFNLFTSFGYFKDKNDNLNVVKTISKHQNEDGILLIDFLNSELVKYTGEIIETKILSGIEFHIHKKITREHVVKDISFSDKGKNYHFQERVQLFNRNEIESMLEICGYDIHEHYGNYNLNPYSSNSPRSIIIGKKKG